MWKKDDYIICVSQDENKAFGVVTLTVGKTYQVLVDCDVSSAKFHLVLIRNDEGRECRYFSYRFVLDVKKQRKKKLKKIGSDE